MAHFLNMAPQNVALYMGAGALLTAVHYHSVFLSCGYKNRIDPPPSPPAPIISHVPHVPSPNVPVPDIFGHPNTLSYSVAIHPRRYTLPKQHLIVENATSLVANDSSELMIGNQLYASPLPGASTVLIISALLLVLFFFLKCLRGKRIGASQRQIVWLNARLEEMQAELTAAVKESLVFEQNYLASQVEIDQLVSHERELQSQLHHLRLEKENQSAKVPQLWEKPDPSNKQRNSLVEQKQLETDNQDLKAINGKVSGERDRLAARVKHLEQALTIANDKVDELNTNAKNNSKELQKAVSKYNLSCQRFKEFQEARSMMGKEMERLETSQYEDGQRIDELKSEAKLTAMEIQKYQSQLLDKDTDLATLSKEKKNLERNFAEQLTAAKLASAAKLEAVEQHARTALETLAKAKDNEIKSLQKKLHAGSEAASRREQDHQTRLEMMSKEKDAEKANELSAVKQFAKEISEQKLLKVNEEHKSALTNLEARLLKEFAGKQSAEKETERSLLKTNEEQVTTVSNLGADLEKSKEKLDAVRNAHQELLSELLKSLQNARNQARNPSIQKEVLEKTIETVIKQLKNAEEQLAELAAEDLESGSAEDNSGDGNSGDKYGSGNGGGGDSDDDQDDGNSSRVKKDVTTGSEEKRHHAGSSYESTKVDSKSASDSHGVLANEPPKNVGSSLDPAGAVDVSASGNSKDSAKSTRTLPAITGEINVSKMTETSKRVFRGHLIVHFIKQTESRAPYPVDKVIELQMPCFDPFYAALPIPQPVQKPQDAAQDSKVCFHCHRQYKTEVEFHNHMPVCKSFFSFAVYCKQSKKIYVMNEAWKIMHDKECNVDDCQSLIEYSSKKPILSGKGKSDPKTPSLIPNVPTGPRSAHFHRKSPHQNQHNAISTSWPTQRQSPANAFSPKAARFTSPGASMQHSRYAPSPQTLNGPRSPAQYPAPSQPQRMMQIDMPPARPHGFSPVEQPTPVPVMPHDDPPVQPQTRNNQRGRNTAQREGWAAAGHNVIRY